MEGPTFSSSLFLKSLRNRENGFGLYHSPDKMQIKRFMISNNLFKEHRIPINMNNKIISSQWLNNVEIIFGSEKNELVVYNVKLQKFRQISSVKGFTDDKTDKQGCIHTIQINPCRSLLLTNAYNFDEIAVYKLPTLDPICLIGGAHKKLITDAVWMNNDRFVSASKDRVVLWKIEDSLYEKQYDDDGELIPVCRSISPLFMRNTQALKMSFIQPTQKLVSISLDKYLTVWDSEIFMPTRSYRMDTHCGCIATQNDGCLCVVGCHSGISLFDPRAYRLLNVCHYSQNRHLGIMSISIQDNIVTVGKMNGTVKFFDVRAGYISKFTINAPEANHNLDNVPRRKNKAIYTHCYDYSGTRLFCAGGPFNITPGCYAGLWL